MLFVSPSSLSAPGEREGLIHPWVDNPLYVGGGRLKKKAFFCPDTRIYCTEYPNFCLNLPENGGIGPFQIFGLMVPKMANRKDNDFLSEYLPMAVSRHRGIVT